MVKYAARGISVDFNGTPIGQLTAFGQVGSSRDLIDASAYGDDWKDFVLGQQDGVEVAGVIAYDPADTGHAAVVSAYEDTPDATVTFTMNHVVSGFSADITGRLTTVTRGGALGELFQLSFTLKITNPGVVEGS